MKTYIHVRDSDKAVVGVGMIRFEDGTLTPEVGEFVKEHGEDEGIRIYGQKVAPAGVTARTISTADLPGNGLPDMSYDKTFLGWRELDGEGNPLQDANGQPVIHFGWTDAKPGKQVDIEMEGAKRIAHARRRIKRTAEFKPLDVLATIPAKAAQAEASRAAVRAKYDKIQTDIDKAEDPAALKALLAENGL